MFDREEAKDSESSEDKVLRLAREVVETATVALDKKLKKESEPNTANTEHLQKPEFKHLICVKGFLSRDPRNHNLTHCKTDTVNQANAKIGITLLLAEVTLALARSINDENTGLPLIRPEIPDASVEMDMSIVLSCLIVFLQRLREQDNSDLFPTTMHGDEKAVVVRVEMKTKHLKVEEFDSYKGVSFSHDDNVATLTFA